MIDELERLAKLWQDGILTDEEFAGQKQRILARSLDAPPERMAPDAASADSDADIQGEDAGEPAAPDLETDFGFDDPDALVHDSAIDDMPQQAEPASPETGNDDLSFDDLDAMLDEALAENADVAADPSASPAPNEDVAPAEDELGLDDINALLDGASAEADEVAPPAELAVRDASAPESADSDLDDLNAMLDGALAEASTLQPSNSEALPPEADLSVDDINALLDGTLAEASTVMTEASSPAPQPDIAVREPEEPAGLDNLEALLDGALADAGISPEEAMPVEASTADTASPVKSADRLGDLNSMLDDILTDADFAPAEALSGDPVADSAELAHSQTEEPPASAPEKGSMSADDDDAGVEDAATPVDAPASAPPPALPGAGRKPRLQFAALLAAIKDRVRSSGKDSGGSLVVRVRRAIAPLSHIRLPFRLPQPVLLGIGALGLFAGTLGLSYAIATASFAPSQAAEPPKAEQDHVPGTEQLAVGAAETEEPPEESAVKTGDTGEEAAADTGAEGAPDGLALMADASEPRIIRDSAEIARKCPVIDALTRAYAGALSAKFRSPDESFGVKQGSGFVRGHAGVGQACLIEITRPGGAARLCRVAGIVQIPGQATAAYLGDGQKDVICAGDPTFAQEG